MSVKKKYSHLGLAIVFYLVVSNILASVAIGIASAIYSFQYVFNLARTGQIVDPSSIDPRLAAEIAARFSEEHASLINLLSMGISYFVVIPLTILFLNSRSHRDIPTIGGFKFSTPYEDSTKRKLSPGEFINFLLFMFPMGIIGSIIGNVLAFFITSVTGANMDDLLTSMLTNMSLPAVLLLSVILAPIFEELLFRYSVIGYARRYGEWNAIIVSALIFGLIHTNIFQFFYAFLLGIILGYVYVYTRRLIYTIIMHITFNFFGAFVPMLIDPTLSNEASPLMIGYNILQYVVAIIGLVLLIRFIKKGNIMESTPEAPIPGKFSIDSILNFGMILLVVVCLGLTVFIALSM
ncbi:lysostaphin resistance A-like protein [Butyrivibrio sp. JL13D10]|uniref:CPBP family intramembrane glutamic endopeptidase n=1 Tax=Butyrivibrio sp. JL13D10 TaxID=3236815 RepID=UPI0038B520C3